MTVAAAQLANIGVRRHFPLDTPSVLAYSERESAGSCIAVDLNGFHVLRLARLRFRVVDAAAKVSTLYVLLVELTRRSGGRPSGQIQADRARAFSATLCSPYPPERRAEWHLCLIYRKACLRHAPQNDSEIPARTSNRCRK